MATHVIYANLDEMVFEGRNKDYGAYYLRKNANRNTIKGFLIAVSSLLLLVLISKGGMMNTPPPPPDPVEKGVPVWMDVDDFLEEIEEPEPPVETFIPPPDQTATAMAPDIHDHIAYEVPEPDDDADTDATIEAIDSLANRIIDDKNTQGDENGSMWGDPDGVPGGEEYAFPVDPVITDPVDTRPDPMEWFAGTAPVPVNLEDIKKLTLYPEPAKEAKIEGKVIFRVLIDKHGKYKEHFLLSKESPGILVKAAEKHLKKLVCTPGIQGNKPIPVWINIPFDFKLLK